jgi:hypothetical protein
MAIKKRGKEKENRTESNYHGCEKTGILVHCSGNVNSFLQLLQKTVW